MNDNARKINLSQQPPVVQLLVTVFIVVVAGTLLFYLFVLAGTLIFGMDMSEMTKIPQGIVILKDIRVLKFVQVSQQVALFIIPAIVISMIMNGGNGSFLKMGKRPSLFPLLLVIILAIFIIPVISFTGILNAKMDLPDWMSGIERKMVVLEDSADYLTGLLIKSRGVVELLLNLTILAVIPAIAEEMIFRGVLQQIVSGFLRSSHAGIWITAILFSAIHLQFFGFLPRLILGLIFGYLFFWSSNLWYPVIAHFINNAVPVVLAYFTGWDTIKDKAQELSGNPLLMPLIPAILSFVILYYLWELSAENFREHSERTL
jgi:membrane protease YdiL (CAAX protease family)